MKNTERYAEPPFVGEGRLRIVEGLIEAYDQVNKSGTPKWISLEAPPGWGKTRIVREFYTRLAKERQETQPGYWPMSMFEHDDVTLDDVNMRRKRIFPQVKHVPGTLPNFAWWGITCSLRHGIPSEALSTDLGLFKAHADYLDDAWLKLPHKKAANRSTMAQFGAAAAEETVMEVAGATIEAVAEVAIPGLGLAKWLVQAGWAQARSKTDRKQRLNSSELISHVDTDIVDETLAMLSRLACKGLPLIIFVEDAHLVDPALMELLAKLIATQAAVLLITSGLPGHIEDLEILSSAMNAHAAIVTRIRHNDVAPAMFAEYTSSDIQLTEQDLQRIVKHYHPAVDPQTLSELAARYRNPLMLELICTRAVYMNMFPDGNLKLDSEDIAELPMDFEGIYLQQWRDLPRVLQSALNLAAHGIPQLISEQHGRSPKWHRPLTLDLLNELDRQNPRLDNDAIAQALEESAVTYSWVHEVTDTLREFTVPGQRELAFEQDNLAFSKIINKLLAKLISVKLCNGEFKTPDDCDYAAWAVLALHRKGYHHGKAALAAATIFLIESLSSYPRELSNQIDIAQYALEHIDRDSSNGREIRLSLATALLEQGKIQSATNVLEELSKDLEVKYGPFHPETLNVRNHLAGCYGAAGRLDEAIYLCRTVMADQARTPEPTDVGVSSNVAYLLGAAGHTDEAIHLYELLLEDERILGAQTRSALNARNNLAYLYGEADNVEKATTLLLDLLADQNESLFPDHPDTLITRMNLYHLYNVSDRPDQAYKSFKGLLDDCKRALGSTHPLTFRARNNLASTYGELGHFDKAIIELENLLQDQSGSLDPDHPDILTTRNNIAVFHIRADRIGVAIELLETLIHDQENILGPAHPATLDTRTELIAIYDAAERFTDLVRLYEPLFKYQVEHLGIGHPDVDITRSALSIYLEEAGRIPEVIALYETYMRKQAQAHGSDHPDVLYARDRIQRYRV